MSVACTCPSGDGSLRWPCPTHPPVTAVDRPDNGQDEGREVVHACPEGTSGVTGCCGRTPFELNRWSRMTLDPALVTCGRAGSGEQQREQVARLLHAHFPQSPQDMGRLADELLSLLGGPQPDGEARQHRMDADCWCGPAQADNGAWDHQ